MRRLRRVVLPCLLGLALLACSPAGTPTPTPSPTPTSIDYTALEAAIEHAVGQDYAEDHVRAVLISVDGQTRIAHYRNGFTASDHTHVFSVTKSVLSILIGIAVGDGLIADVDQPLSTLLPTRLEAMTKDTAKITLRDVMTMSAGFQNEITGGLLWDEASKPGQSYVDYILRGRTAVDAGRTFVYADVSAHIASAVLATALQRGGRASSVVDFAREKLFEPLGIRIGPGWHKPLPDVFDPRFGAAGFGWGTDPNGLELGGYGLRLTAPDMLKIGELCRGDGNWHGKQVVPTGWLQQVTTPSRGSDEYGMFWWIIDDAQVTGYLASGFGGQWIGVLPKSGAVVVVLSQVPPEGAAEDGGLGVLAEVVGATFS